MYLEKLIKKLKEVQCTTSIDRKNVDINIKLCEMQIAIRDKFKKRSRHIK